MLRTLFMLLLTTVMAEASVTYVVPHYTLRTGWFNVLRLSVNQVVTSEPITLTAFSDQGHFLGVKTFQVSEPGFINADPRELFNAAGVDQGWIMFELPPGVRGSYSYSSYMIQGFAQTPLWLPTRSLDLTLGEPADTVNALAVCNPNNHAITVELTLAGGSQAATTKLELGPRAKFKGTCASLFDTPITAAQRLQLRADAPFSAIGLAFTPEEFKAMRYEYDEQGATDVVEALARTEAPGWGRAISLRMPGREAISLREGSGDEHALSEEYAMDLGSGSEPMVAALFMLYWEQGLLDLDQNIATFFPTLAHASQISIRQLLNHSSGLADFATTEAYSTLRAQALVDHRPTTPEQLLALARSQGDDGYMGGTARSATNYLLLAEIVPQLTGRSLAQELRSRIFAPLDMSHTYVAGVEEVPVRAFAFTYLNGQLQETTRHLDDSWYGSAYSVVTTPEDHMRFMQALLQGQLLGPQAQRAMAPHLSEFSTDRAYGLWRVGFLDNFIISVAFNRGVNGNAISAFFDNDDAGFAIQWVDGRYGTILGNALLQWMIDYLSQRIDPQAG